MHITIFAITAAESELTLGWPCQAISQMSLSAFPFET